VLANIQKRNKTSKEKEEKSIFLMNNYADFLEFCNFAPDK
jgi:hypothetical protein